MAKNIGWFYNKQYFEKEDECSEYDNEMNQYNQELTELDYNEYRTHSNFLKSIWEKYENFSLKTCYPGLVTGVGVNHQTTIERKTKSERSFSEFKLGFHFDHTTGIPTIPGASVKGVLRDAFPLKYKGNDDQYNYRVGYIAYVIDRIKAIEREVECTFKLELENAAIQIIGEEVYNNMIRQIEEKKESIQERFEDALLDLSETISAEEFKCREQAIPKDVEKEIQRCKDDVITTYFHANNRRKRELDRISNNAERNRNEILKQKVGELVERIGVEPFVISPEASEYVEKIERNIFDGELEGEKLSVYERDIFFDAIFARGNQDNRFLANDYLTPHKNRFQDPIPIQFLKLLPDVTLRFIFDLKDTILTKSEKLLLFEVILLDHGIGAKTNVGYGQLKL